MNQVIYAILRRRSVRAYQERPVPPEVKAQVLQAAMRAPTAGNLMLYSIIEVDDQAIKDTLAKTCDNQPFIARAPWVLLFVADYQRWQDYFEHCGAREFARSAGLPLRKPAEGDLMLGCCDALIAAQTAVVAAESLGLGSCYIGDIMENYEAHQALFELPRYVFPICLLCFGYPTRGQAARKQADRFKPEYIVFKNRYRRLGKEEFEKMFKAEHDAAFKDQGDIDGARNVGQLIYRRKFSAGFMLEMNRSVRAMLKNWSED
jgi:FMN reductase (NADPH)/FMN reductase [NAD(P)H]